MVEVLLESSGQDVVVASESRSHTPIECSGNLQSEEITPENAYLTPVQRFYAGQSIFVTGATGFMGKVLLEKLLRSCPNLAVIYVLVRAKKGKDVHQRTEEIFDDPLFDRLKEERPKFRHQVVAISGDCSTPHLGISLSDKTKLIENVSIVFHVAATVRFDEKIKLATAINVQAPRDIVALCKEMPKLKSIIHVSTAYAHCPRNCIDEKLYEAPIDSDKLIVLMDCIDDKLVDEITPRLLGKWPNTYTYTKAVAENVIQKEAGQLPVAIFRPGIVISTYQEPVRGWIDNMYGATGVAAGAGTGLLRSLHCDGALEANVVPVDLTVNALIAAAWDVANTRSQNNNSEDGDIPVYNYVSKDNPLTWDGLKIQSCKYGLDMPTNRAVWYYSFRNNRNKLMHLFCVYFLHLLPALLIDAATLCVGKEPRLLKIYKKIHKFMEVLNYFTTREWTFSNDRVQQLTEKLSMKDKDMFPFDMRQLNWDLFFQTYIQGIRVYLIKDPLDTLPEARARWRRMYWMHQALKLLMGYVFLRVSWAAISYLLHFVNYV